MTGAPCALLGLALLLSGCGGSAGPGANAAEQAEDKKEEKEDAIPVRVAALRREPLSSLYSTSATLRAEKQATVTARTRGVVRRVLVEEGARVTAAQELAILEDDEQRIEVARTSAARETRQREFERAQDLHAKALISDETHETAYRAFREAEQAAALAELTLSRTVIRAPFAGTIVRRHVDVGATVADGTAVYELVDVEPLLADVNVPERHVARLAPGLAVRLTLDAGGGQADARIERISPAVDPSTGTVKVTLSVGESRGMRPGGFVRVDIVTDTHAEALVVPRAALVAEGRRWHLFLLAASRELVEKVEVELGYEEGDRVEILATHASLEPGRMVVTAGAAALTDGARVEVVEEVGGAVPPGGGGRGVAT
jgi:membrane fusion protein (multidrug efflux system)